MNGGADLGGMHGFGPVREEPNEPHFHAEWEARVMAMVDRLRSAGAMEPRPVALRPRKPSPAGLPDDALLRRVARGLRAADAGARHGGGGGTGNRDAAGVPPVETPGPLSASEVEATLRRGGPVDREAAAEPRFAVGDEVTTINDHPRRPHPLAPLRTRAAVARSRHVLGYHVFPDTNARRARARTRNGSTRSVSGPPNCGAATQTRATRSRSTCGSPILLDDRKRVVPGLERRTRFRRALAGAELSR